MTAYRLATLLLLTTILCAQDPLQILPNNYRLEYQNEYVRVIHVHYAAHQKLPLHNHSEKPTVYVYLTDSGPVRFSHIEEHPFSLLRPPEKAGAFRVSPGRLEKHTVENVGDIPSEFLRVELTQLPLGFQASSFRSPKSFDLSRSGIDTEFSCPFFEIRRVIATGYEATKLIEQDGPALLISLSVASLRRNESFDGPQILKRGDVLWMKRGRGCRIRSVASDAPGHLLEIRFLPSA